MIKMLNSVITPKRIVGANVPIHFETAISLVCPRVFPRENSIVKNRIDMAAFWVNAE
jgi:hypothetical protein